MSKTEKTIKNFETMNCNQAVLASYGPDFGISEDICFAIGLSYGGGMGKQGKTCGAVTGAYTTIGLWSAQQTSDKDKQKQIATEKVQEFNKLFEKKNDSIECKTLLKYDLSIPEQAKEAEAKGLFDSICPKLVGGSSEILEKILF